MLFARANANKNHYLLVSAPMTVARRFVLVLAAASAAVSLAACGGGGDGSSAKQAAVATTTQVGDMLRHVAGDRMTVRQIMQANSDPHAYEPRPSDVKAVTGAKLVVRSGGDIDDWLGDVLRNAGSNAKRLTLIDFVSQRHVEGEHGHQGGHAGNVDPHWWQSLRNGIVAVEKIRDALTAVDPGGRATYAANATRYIHQIRALDRAITGCMAAIADPQRKLVTDHDALGYYADRYNIEVIGAVIPALTTQAQPSAGSLARLARTIRAAGVKTIFAETSVNEKLSQAIARESGARVGAPLYGDTLGPKGSPGATYLGSVRANTTSLVDGFTNGAKHCALPQAPPGTPPAS
jgi:ABC-type Zn uptake system ZnuABC Zn-binding protein ZnuA